MPTQQQRRHDLPSPAWTFALLAGAHPNVRVTGWPAQAQAGQFGEPTAAHVWQEHREGLLAEAAAHGFVPFAETQHRPTGAGFEAWRAAFLATHRY